MRPRFVFAPHFALLVACDTSRRFAAARCVAEHSVTHEAEVARVAAIDWRLYNDLHDTESGRTHDGGPCLGGCAPLSAALSRDADDRAGTLSLVASWCCEDVRWVWDRCVTQRRYRETLVD